MATAPAAAVLTWGIDAAARAGMRSSGAGGGALVRVGTASAVATNFTGTGLAPATPYDHRVAGPDGAGGTTSTRCASITTTPIAPPSGLTAVSNGPDWIDRT